MGSQPRSASTALFWDSGDGRNLPAMGSTLKLMARVHGFQTSPSCLPRAMEANVAVATAKDLPSPNGSLAGEKETLRDVKFETQDGHLVSYDPVFNSDPSALASFLQYQGSIKPSWTLRITAHHPEELAPGRITRDGPETRWIKRVAFDFTIDLSQDLLDEPVFWTVDDMVPAFRGAMVLEREVGGVKQKAAGGKQDEDWDVAKSGTSLRRAPWLTSKYSLPHATYPIDSNPLSSSHTLQDWCRSYTSSPATLKDLTFLTTVYGWNTLAIQDAIEELLGGMGFTKPRFHVQVQIESSPHSIQVRSSSFLKYPFLWLWRRFRPDTGGKWEVMGSAFATNRWILLKDTYPTETLEEARSRLLATPAQEEYPWITDETKWPSRMRLGQGGVWVWVGLREGEWFRKWEGAIRNAAASLYQGPLKVDYVHELHEAHVQGGWTKRAGGSLDG